MREQDISDLNKAEPEITEKAQRRGGRVLPEETREDLKTVLQVLLWTQTRLSKESNVSGALVSNLISGHQTVRDAERVSRVTATLEQRAESRFMEGFLNDKQKLKIAETLNKIRDIYNINPNPEELLKRSELVDFMRGFLSGVLEKNTQLTRIISEKLQGEHFPGLYDQVSAAMSIANVFNRATQTVLKEHEGILLPGGKGLDVALDKETDTVSEPKIIKPNLQD